MEWLDENIAADEELIFMTRPHFSLFSRSAIALIMSTIHWLFLFPAAAVLLYDLLIFYTHQYVVTDQRFIQKRGLYYIRIKDWPLQKIDNVICTRSLGDRLKGSGSVILIGFTISKSYFKSVANPQQLRDAIHSQLPAKTSYFWQPHPE